MRRLVMRAMQLAAGLWALQCFTHSPGLPTMAQESPASSSDGEGSSASARAASLHTILLLSCGAACMRCPDRCVRRMQSLDAEAALLALRDSISNWLAFAAASGVDGWNATTPLCQWGGVSCTNQGSVQSV